MQSKEKAVGSTAKTFFGMLEYLATHRPLTHICENVDDIVAEGSANLYNMELLLFQLVKRLLLKFELVERIELVLMEP